MKKLIFKVMLLLSAVVVFNSCAKDEPTSLLVSVVYQDGDCADGAMVMIMPYTEEIENMTEEQIMEESMNVMSNMKLANSDGEVLYDDIESGNYMYFVISKDGSLYDEGMIEVDENESNKITAVLEVI